MTIARMAMVMVRMTRMLMAIVRMTRMVSRVGGWMITADHGSIPDGISSDSGVGFL